MTEKTQSPENYSNPSEAICNEPTSIELNICERVPGWMTREELRVIGKKASFCNSWMEVGVYCGRSLLMAGLKLKKHGRLIGIDIELFEHHETGQSLYTTIETLRRKRPDIGITLHRGTMKDFAQQYETDVDHVFIDADHSYEKVTQDLHCATNNFVHSITQLSGHDYREETHPGVTHAVDEFFEKTSYRAQIADGTIWEVAKDNGEES